MKKILALVLAAMMLIGGCAMAEAAHDKNGDGKLVV